MISNSRLFSWNKSKSLEVIGNSKPGGRRLLWGEGGGCASNGRIYSKSFKKTTGASPLISTEQLLAQRSQQAKFSACNSRIPKVMCRIATAFVTVPSRIQSSRSCWLLVVHRSCSVQMPVAGHSIAHILSKSLIGSVVDRSTSRVHWKQSSESPKNIKRFSLFISSSAKE
jgi:hypothetical protein